MDELAADLRERLLRGGVSPARVERYLGELADHAAEIARNEPRVSAAEALSRLGTPEQLAEAMLADPRWRSWTRRAPFFVFVAAPLGGLGAVAALLAAMVVLAATLERSSPLVAATGTLAQLLLLAAPVALGWLLVVAAHRRRMRVLWPALGVVVLALAGAATQLEVAMPGAGQAGTVAVSVSQPHALTILVIAVAASLPALFSRLSRSLLDV